MKVILWIMDQRDTKIDRIKCRSLTYILWSSDFAQCLEECLMEEYYIWDNRSHTCGTFEMTNREIFFFK